MRVHEHSKTPLFTLSKDCNDIVHIGIIVLFRPCMFEALPGEDISKKVVSPSFQPGEMEVCRTIIKIQRFIDEITFSRFCSFPKAFSYVTWLVIWVLGRS